MGIGQWSAAVVGLGLISSCVSHRAGQAQQQYARKQYRECAVSFRQVLSETRPLPQYTKGLALCEYRSQRWAEALAAIDQYLAAPDLDLPKLMGARASCLAQLGRPDEAMVTFAKALDRGYVPDGEYTSVSLMAVLSKSGRRGAVLLAASIGARGWRIEEEIAAMRNAVLADWVTLEQASAAPELAKGKFLLARLKLSGMRFDQERNVTLAAAEEWRPVREIAGFETRTVMHATRTTGSTYIPGTTSTASSSGQAHVGGGIGTFRSSHETTINTPGRWTTSTSVAQVPVAETHAVWATRFERTGFVATVGLGGYDPNLSGKDWHYVLAVSLGTTTGSTPTAHQANVPLLEIVTYWLAPIR
jgi:pentatricopeptide repeat protein